VAEIIRMTHCCDLEVGVAAYIDGEATPSQRDEVERHLRRCQACQERVTEERAVRGALRAHRDELRGEGAPLALRARLAGLAEQARPQAAGVATRLVRLAAAAAIVLAFGGWALGLVTRDSTVLLAAQLSADHAKCFFTAHDRGLLDPEQTAERLRSRYGFDLEVPPSSRPLGLRLVGARRCLSGEGTNAHLLYTWRGESVSLYMLPGDHRPDDALSVLGHDARVWSGHNGTYVLVAHQSDRDLTPLVEFMRHATE
jgi:hypothetical protein